MILCECVVSCECTTNDEQCKMYSIIPIECALWIEQWKTII